MWRLIVNSLLGPPVLLAFLSASGLSHNSAINLNFSLDEGDSTVSSLGQNIQHSLSVWIPETGDFIWRRRLLPSVCRHRVIYTGFTLRYGDRFEVAQMRMDSLIHMNVLTGAPLRA